MFHGLSVNIVIREGQSESGKVVDEGRWYGLSRSTPWGKRKNKNRKNRKRRKQMKRGLWIAGIACLALFLAIGIATADLVTVALDIKPRSCPNPLNVASRGVLPVAILGTVDFDVTDIDVSTILLEGVAPIRWAFADVATPFNGSYDDDCFDCTTDGFDGLKDLVLLFKRQEVVAMLGPVSDRDCVQLMITGALFDGTPIEGTDSIIILDKKRR
jgi:hypothetical protein